MVGESKGVPGTSGLVERQLSQASLRCFNGR